MHAAKARLLLVGTVIGTNPTCWGGLTMSVGRDRPEGGRPSVKVKAIAP